MNTKNNDYYYSRTKENIKNLIYFFLKSNYQEILINMYDENQYDYHQINIHKFYIPDVSKEKIIGYIHQIITEIYTYNPKLSQIISMSLNNEILKISRP